MARLASEGAIMRCEWIATWLGIAISACGSGGPPSTIGPPGDVSTDGPANADAEPSSPESGPRPSDAGEISSDTARVGDAPVGDASIGDAPIGDGPISVAPTVSSWLGTNIDGDLPRVDVAYQLNPFDTPAAQRDANGYPMAGASGKSTTDIGFVLPTGTYKISYRGTGTLAVSGIGRLGGTWQSANGEQRNTVQITGTPGAFGNFLTLAITNAFGQSVQGIHLFYPGFDYGATVTFLPQFIQLLAPFRAMRFMDWEGTNSSTLTNFADRPSASHFGRSTFGEPYEHIAELVNETGKDAWITIPELATDAFITEFAQFMAQNLDFTRIQAARKNAGFVTPFQLIVENSNETWNQGFSAYATFLAAANTNPARYTGTYSGAYGPSWMTSSANLMKVGQYEADRLVKIGNAFRTAFGANSAVVAPVLSGWALGPAYSDVGLQFIKANYGDPKQYVTYVAQAPYFNTADDTSTGALDTLFAALGTNIAGMDATFKDFGKLAAQYGVEIAAYEGGQSLTGTTNQSLKHLAQHDVRMYEAYKSYLALWKQDFGPSLFMHFSLAGTPGLPETIYQYGYWGSIIGVLEDLSACELNLPTLAGNEAIASAVHHCPKYRALAEHVPQ
jgi:hypothetical protein